MSEGVSAEDRRAPDGEPEPLLEAISEIVNAAEPGLSIPPADCTNNCGLGPCDCSGEYRVRAWSIDVPRLRVLLDEARGE